jgi:hypothetical protein
MNGGTESIERVGDDCYFCDGELAEGGSIKVQMESGEPKRECCPDCFRNWPPDGVPQADRRSSQAVEEGACDE